MQGFSLSWHDQSLSIEVNICPFSHLHLQILDVFFILSEGPRVCKGNIKFFPCLQVNCHSQVNIPFDKSLEFNRNCQSCPLPSFFLDNRPIQIDYFRLSYKYFTAAERVLTLKRHIFKLSISASACIQKWNQVLVLGLTSLSFPKESCNSWIIW